MITIFFRFSYSHPPSGIIVISCSVKPNLITSAMDQVTVTFLCHVHLLCTGMKS